MATERQEKAAPTGRAAAPLHVCGECDSALVYPLDWTAAGPERWKVMLCCPNCWTTRSGTFDQSMVDAFDEELDEGVEALVRDLTELAKANMADDVERLVAALHADAILPEDF